jgi:hypothetical protein
VNTVVVMPDHLHGIVYVKEEMSKPLGSVMRGFKSGATSELRKITGDPNLAVWSENYHDRVIMNSDTLRAERAYIQDNPRRYCVCKAHPDLFVRLGQMQSPRLPSDTHWQGFGNRFLLDRPTLFAVQVSRRMPSEELARLKEQIAQQVADRAVLVSAFISPGEKPIAKMVMADMEAAV